MPSPRRSPHAGAETVLVSGPVGACRTAARQARARRDGARDVAACEAAPARRYRGVHGGRRRLAARDRRQPQAEEARRAVPRSSSLENPDILAGLARQRSRPRWSSALPPRPTTSSPMPPPSATRKGCDWIIANDVSTRRHGRRQEPRPSDHRERHGSLAGNVESRSRAPSGLARIAATFGKRAA